MEELQYFRYCNSIDDYEIWILVKINITVPPCIHSVLHRN